MAATVEPPLIDSVQAEREEPVEAALERALSSFGQENFGITRRAATETARAMTVRDMAVLALERNLAVRRSGIAQDIARQTLLQAEALFRPVLSLSFNDDYSHSKARTVSDYKFKKALVPCDDIASMHPDYLNRNRWYQLFSEGPVLALVYANPPGMPVSITAGSMRTRLRPSMPPVIP